MTIDYPCELGLGPQPYAEINTRITYCISWWPRNAISGGGVAAEGYSDQNRIEINPTGAFGNSLVIERQDQDLTVNGQTIQEGETYSRYYFSPSLNPWLLLTVRLTAVNRGRLEATSNENQAVKTEAIYLSGDVNEGWALNPLGPICLMVGVLLVVLGVRERKRGRKIDEGQYPNQAGYR